MDKKTGQQPTNPNKTLFGKLIDGNHFIKTLREHWIDEKNGLRKGWVGTLLTCLVVGFAAYQWGTHSADGILKKQSATIENFSSANLTNFVTIENLNEKIREKDENIQKLTSERDAARNEALIQKNAVASWQLLAQSKDTNTPLTERLNTLIVGLTKNTESLTNVYESVKNTPQNIFENMTTESYSLSDTNHFCIVDTPDPKRIYAVCCLNYVPVKGSVEAFCKDNGGFGAELRLSGNNVFYKNVSFYILYNYPTNNTTITFRYMMDKQQTNLFSRVPTASEGVRLNSDGSIGLPLEIH